MNREFPVYYLVRELALHLASVGYDHNIVTSLCQLVREIDDMALNSADIQFRQYLDYLHGQLTCSSFLFYIIGSEADRPEQLYVQEEEDMGPTHSEVFDS